MTTRRNLLRAAALAPVVAALPALACNPEADPAIVATRAYMAARAAYVAACDEWASDQQVEAAGLAESSAAIVALSTVPTTPAGVRAFCEFGAWLLGVDEAELSEWFPGHRIAGADQRSAEEMYFTTLNSAARALLPAVPQDIGTIPLSATAPPATEPLAKLISAYRSECAALNANEDGFLAGNRNDAFDALNEVEGLPTAQSREVALDALRLALEIESGMMGEAAVPNLVQAALAHFERQA